MHLQAVTCQLYSSKIFYLQGTGSVVAWKNSQDAVNCGLESNTAVLIIPPKRGASLCVPLYVCACVHHARTWLIMYEPICSEVT